MLTCMRSDHACGVIRHSKVKGKDSLHITIVETVRAVQYDTPGVLDVCDVVGAVQCKADVDGSPELTLSQ